MQIGWERSLESLAELQRQGAWQSVTVFTLGDVTGTFSWLHDLYAQASHMSIPRTQGLRRKQHILMKRTAKLYCKDLCHACINSSNFPNSWRGYYYYSHLIDGRVGHREISSPKIVQMVSGEAWIWTHQSGCIICAFYHDVIFSHTVLIWIPQHQLERHYCPFLLTKMKASWQ